MVTGKGRCSRSTVPKFLDMPKFVRIYCVHNCKQASSVDVESTLTIGSCGTGRGPISTRVSAAIPSALSVHARTPEEIHEMYLRD